MSTLAIVIVIGSGCWLIGFAAWLLFAPAQASAFLNLFAGSRKVHLFELAVRIIVGAAFILAAENMRFPFLSQLFGWVLVITTLVLLVLPWRSHQRFATRVVPMALTYAMPFAISALLLGAFVLYAAL